MKENVIHRAGSSFGIICFNSVHQDLSKDFITRLKVLFNQSQLGFFNLLLGKGPDDRRLPF